VKLFAIVSLLTFILISGTSLAQIQYYGIENTIDKEGKSSIKLTITFAEPVKNFKFTFFGKIEKLEASSIAGPVNCKLMATEASLINCDVNLTLEKRTLEIKFETGDLVKTLNSKFYFNGDFSLNQNTNVVFTSIKLPEGMVLIDEESKQVFPENATTLSDGRRIMVNWNLNNITASQALKFQVFYEPVGTTLPPLLQLGVVATLAVIGTGIFIYQRVRKPKEVILSVLDEHERKVIDIITVAGGEVNQKKVVQETNLSKAKVSRVVKNLAERGLLEVKRTGRTNRLKLVKKKFEF